ncbi:MAG TPA: ribokinase [Firmicutes bacterium]|jgi:ribokinase|nr:ribokinase [Bacillota bacterium]
MKKICVVGSINMDLIVTANRFPQPGETLVGKEFNTFPGGKGANQAVAAGRLQADVRMVGKIGDDMYGAQLIHNLQENGVKTSEVMVDSNYSTGIAAIEVDGTGENHIIIVPGANGKVDIPLIDEKLDAMLEADIFLFQLEIPLETVIYAMRKLKEHGKTIILDPAPACPLPEEIYRFIDFLTPNETEIAMITGREIKTMTDIKEAAASLYQKGVGAVIVKAGSHGAYFFSKKDFFHCPGFTVKAVDTTGAGDSFNGGLAVSLAGENGVKESVKFANAVGALSTTAKGAQNAMPTLTQVTSLIKNQGK